MEKLSAKETAKRISYVLQAILGENGLNLLGEYELRSGTQVLQTVPSIQIRYPRKKIDVNGKKTNDIERAVVPYSGIEVVIYPQPNQRIEDLKGGDRQSIKNFMVTLDQHDTTEVLTEAVDAIVSNQRVDVHEQPEIIGARETKSGVQPARAILLIRQIHLLESTC